MMPSKGSHFLLFLICNSFMGLTQCLMFGTSDRWTDDILKVLLKRHILAGKIIKEKLLK